MDFENTVSTTVSQKVQPSEYKEFFSISIYDNKEDGSNRKS